MLSIILKPILLLSMPGESEWLLILLVILLFFGGKKIPDLMRGIGKGLREFNDAKQHVKDEIEQGMKEKDSQLLRHRHLFQLLKLVSRPTSLIIKTLLISCKMYLVGL